MAARRGRPAVGSSIRSGGSADGRADRSAEQRATPATPAFTRPALAPSLLAAVVLIACLVVIDTSGFVFARWGVTVLSLIVLVFAVRGRTWWAAALMAAVAVLWNPLVTVPLPGQAWASLQLVAAAVFVGVGIAVRVPRPAD